MRRIMDRTIRSASGVMRAYLCVLALGACQTACFMEGSASPLSIYGCAVVPSPDGAARLSRNAPRRYVELPAAVGPVKHERAEVFIRGVLEIRVISGKNIVPLESPPADQLYKPSSR